MPPKKRVASSEDAPSVPNKRMRRAKNPRDGMHKAIEGFTTFPDPPTYEDHQNELNIYKALTHKTRDLQLKAAAAVSRALVGQVGNEEPVEPSITEEELTRHLNEHVFPALTKGHAVAREGTFRVLSKVLSSLIGERGLTASRYPSLTFDVLLEMLVRHTALGESAVDDDQALGRLLGLRCFVQKDILSKDAGRWSELLPLLLELAVKNNEVRLACGSIIADSAESLDQGDASFTVDAVSESSIAKTAEGLAIFLAAARAHPSLKSKTWKKPISSKSAPGLPTLLKESATKVLNENAGAIDNGKRSTWTSPLHFVWDKLAQYFGSLGDDSIRDFTSLWTPVVEEHLFAKNATDLQKARGFLVFQRMLKGVAEHKILVSTLFGRNFMSCLQNHASRKERHLHTVAADTLACIEQVAATEPKSVVPIMQGLLGPNGSYDFEQRTHTKAVEKVLKHTKPEDVKAVLTLLEAPFKKASGSGKERTTATGNAYVLYLYYLASGNAPAALEKLCAIAFGGPDVTSKYGLTDSSKATRQTQVESALAKASRVTGNFDHLCEVVGSMKPDSLELEEEVAAQHQLAAKNLKTLMKKKQKKGASEEDVKMAQDVALLHAVALFSLYSRAPGAEALLIGVNTFYEKFEGGEDEETWQLLVAKVLIPMIHRPSSLGRAVSKHVFERFSGKLDLEAMELLVERLEFTEDLSGYNHLLEDINAMDASDDEEDSDMEMDEADGAVEDEGEGESDADSDEGSDGSMDIDQSALLKALGDHLLGADAEKASSKGDKAKKKKKGKGKKNKEEEEEDSGSNSDMTDSEMMAINDTLVAAFDHLSGGGAESSEAKEAKTFVLQFKNRVVDLVDVYLAQHSRNTPIIFPLLPSLVRLTSATTSSDLRVRVVELLEKYRKRFLKDRKRWAEEGHGSAKEMKESFAVLEEIHGEIGLRDSQKFAKAASMACLTVAAAVVAVDRNKIGELNRMHEKLEAELTPGGANGKKKKVHKSFFETWKAYQQSVCDGE